MTYGATSDDMRTYACVHAAYVRHPYLPAARLLVCQCIPDAVRAHDDRGAAPSQDGGGHDGLHRGDGRDGRAAVEIADPAAHLFAQCW